MGSRQQARKTSAPPRPRAKPLPRKAPSKASTPRPTPKPKNPFLVFFRALAALIDAHRSRQTDPIAQVLIAGIEALLTRAEEALAAPDKVRLVPHREGPVVGLRIVDPSVETEPLPADHDPSLAALGAGLALVLEHHDQQPNSSAAACELAAAVWAALGVAKRYLEAPEGKALGAITTTGEASLRLVDASPPAPSSSPPIPPPPALGPAHHALAWSTFEAIDSLSDVREAVSAVEADTEALRLDGAETGHLEATLATLRSDLWTLGGHLATISHNLTGESAADSLASHAAALRLLVLLTSDESQRRYIERRVLDGASGAFAKPAA